ncbi:WRKY DNA-binding transcription factor 70-like [Actinidia eriantha]|uniref:WRKY DNA-binding transcription factor 70-like n=1 Tax=Actinidia eriantha TaxID=165200 RepID=UPI0025861E21|nr:WRKY DNA-binding transcription factor 70-like [Actinidia eriantha]
MGSSSPEKISCDRKRAVQELIQGRELANQLRLLLGKPFGGDDMSVAAKDLVMKILGSFTETISILKRHAADEVSDQVPANSPCWDGRKSEDSDEITSKTSALKDRRGCYKRRKTSQTWTRVAPSLIDDGYAWRKYGQKVILNAKYPRNYYRCTHKFDQSCQATKQVQRTEDDPAMYRTTYHGHHTCKNLLQAPQIILDANPKDSSFLLSFGTTNTSTKSHDPYFATFPCIKQEYRDEKPCLNHIQSSSSDIFTLPDLSAFESCEPVTGSDPDHGHGDAISSGVYSCTTSTTSLDMDMDLVVGSVDFDDAFEFEFC